jgi:hypothetical protein
MFDNALNEGSVALRLDFQVVKAVHYRGFIQVLRVAIAAWWNQPRLPSDLPARLREDMGLPPDRREPFWPQPSGDPMIPPPIWRPGL